MSLSFELAAEKFASEVADIVERSRPLKATVVSSKGKMVQLKFVGELEAGSTWFVSQTENLPAGVEGALIKHRGSQAMFVPAGMSYIVGIHHHDKQDAITIGTTPDWGNPPVGPTAEAFIQIGWGAAVYGLYAMAIGWNSAATENALAVGRGAWADHAGGNGIALGAYAHAGGPNDVTIGVYSNTLGSGGSAVAVGADAQAKSGISVAVGYATRANFSESVAVGAGAEISGNGGVAVGLQANAGLTAISVGFKAKALGNNGIAIGTESVATLRGHAIGTSAIAADAGTSIGYNSSTAFLGVAVGFSSLASGDNSISIGYQSPVAGGAKGSNSIAIGYGALADGGSGIAIGLNTIAAGADIAIGNGATTQIGSNWGKIAIGYTATNNYERGFAIGRQAATLAHDQGVLACNDLYLQNSNGAGVQSISLRREDGTRVYLRVNNSNVLTIATS